MPLERLFRPAIVTDELPYHTQHGLIDQSLNARMGVETTNKDGFALGWPGRAPQCE